MIALESGLYVDECDPLYPRIQDFGSWAEVKRVVGSNLNRTLCGTYILVTAEDDFPDYREVRAEILDVCRRLNANA